MSVFVSGALVLAKYHFTMVENICQVMYFQELYMWLAREHQLSQLIDAPGRSFWLLEPLWAPMVALGGSWRKYMKPIILLRKPTFSFPRAILNVSQEVYSGSFKMHEDIVLSTSGSKARKPPNQASWGWF